MVAPPWAISACVERMPALSSPVGRRRRLRRRAGTRPRHESGATNGSISTTASWRRRGAVSQPVRHHVFSLTRRRAHWSLLLREIPAADGSQGHRAGHQRDDRRDQEDEVQARGEGRPGDRGADRGQQERGQGQRVRVDHPRARTTSDRLGLGG